MLRENHNHITNKNFDQVNLSPYSFSKKKSNAKRGRSPDINNSKKSLKKSGSTKFSNSL